MYLPYFIHRKSAFLFIYFCICINIQHNVNVERLAIFKSLPPCEMKKEIISHQGLLKKKKYGAWHRIKQEGHDDYT